MLPTFFKIIFGLVFLHGKAIERALPVGDPMQTQTSLPAATTLNPQFWIETEPEFVPAAILMCSIKKPVNELYRDETLLAATGRVKVKLQLDELTPADKEQITKRLFNEPRVRLSWEEHFN